jgi:hypothetical protein
LPPPVGITTNASRPAIAAAIASRCNGRSDCSPNVRSKTESIAAVGSVGAGGMEGAHSRAATALAPHILQDASRGQEQIFTARRAVNQGGRSPEKEWQPQLVKFLV